MANTKTDLSQQLLLSEEEKLKVGVTPKYLYSNERFVASTKKNEICIRTRLTFLRLNTQFCLLKEIDSVS